MAGDLTEHSREWTKAPSFYRFYICPVLSTLCPGTARQTKSLNSHSLDRAAFWTLVTVPLTLLLSRETTPKAEAGCGHLEASSREATGLRVPPPCSVTRCSLPAPTTVRPPLPKSGPTCHPQQRFWRELAGAELSTLPKSSGDNKTHGRATATLNQTEPASLAGT